MSLLSFSWFFYTIGVVTCLYYFLITVKCFLINFRAYVLPKFIRCNKDLATIYGSWAVVTGATDGIGLAYSKELASRKLNIVLISRTEEKLKRVSAEIEKEFSVQTKIIVADFSEGRQVYERIERELKNISFGILINNVGVCVPYPLHVTEMTENLMWDILNVNCASVLFMTRIMLPQMQKNGRGAIVNISSFLDRQPTPMMTVYSASKAFVTSFTKGLQYENRNRGITIQLVSPGVVDTNMTKVVHNMLPDSLSPDATSFVKQAIGTLGVLNNTTGYLSHCIMTTFIELCPTASRTYIVGIILRLLRKSIQTRDDNKES